MNDLNQRVLDQLDIVDVVGSYIPLQQKGKSFVCVCPFHQDTHPSMSVSKEKQIFKCFACGEGGNAITFIQKYNNISYREALKIAADRAGIKFDENTNVYEIPSKVSRVHDLNKHIVDFCNYLLHQDTAAKQYLASRGLNIEIADRFGMGIFHDVNQLKQYLLNKGFKESELVENGVMNNQGLSMWQDRLMIPIKDPNGHVVGFSARLLSTSAGQAKYVNSIESEVFKKSKLLYHMDEAYKAARRMKYILLVEGNVDVQQLSAHGYENAVATMGTSLTEGQIYLLKRLNVPIVLCMDGDDAGVRATEKNYHLLKNAGIEAECIHLPDSMDPDECLRRDPHIFKDIVESHPHYLDFKLTTYQEAAAGFNVKQKFILDYMKVLIEQNNPIAEDHFLKKLSEVTGVDHEKISAQYAILKPSDEKKYEVKVKKNVSENIVDWKQKSKALINFKNKPRLNYKAEITENYDKKSEKAIAFDKNQILDRKDILLKYIELKGAVLETTITLLNYDDVETHVQRIADEVLNKLSQNLKIDRGNLNYIGYLHLDTKHPHLHIQAWQNEPFLSEYKLSPQLVDQLEKAVDLEMQTAPEFDQGIKL